MNLESTLSIYGGGQGSGCNGPNCGRPAKKAGAALDPKLDEKPSNKKNMHDIAKVLQSHGFAKMGGGGGNRAGQRLEHSGAQYGTTSRWERLGKQEVQDPNNELTMGNKFRKQSVLVSPAGWAHSSMFKDDYQTHGRGLSADSLEKHLKAHGL
jgi:hypothetical protein